MSGVERRKLLETLRGELEGMAEALGRMEAVEAPRAEIEEIRNRLAAAQESARELEALGARSERRQPFFIGVTDDLASLLSGEAKTSTTIH